MDLLWAELKSLHQKLFFKMLLQNDMTEFHTISSEIISKENFQELKSWKEKTEKSFKS